ncbi:MAG: hypothetical protein UY72_C0036G0018 [Candidatus Uhrbacteria bacterium GW2011_GWD2_52_7]|uniref:Uncharacterized protein n=1 Tax=Candidatus Uhrbacteria bacterium GW2011_GWD2_52_7 TaxID=1618989 RepID=A0A0G1XFG8_9BACT|nr:MAG: hypothetical protein UY72_C0036G0018 [Candidatus Uhrbacteria bacterium GW2011_GWD2_52_7]
MARKTDWEERDIRDPSRCRQGRRDESGDPEPLDFGERKARDFGRMARFRLDIAFHPENGFGDDD